MKTIVFIYHMSPFPGQMLYLLAFFKSWKLCIVYYSESPPAPQFYHDTVKINFYLAYTYKLIYIWFVGHFQGLNWFEAFLYLDILTLPKI